MTEIIQAQVTAMGEPEVIAGIRAAVFSEAALPTRIEQYKDILAAYDAQVAALTLATQRAEAAEAERNEALESLDKFRAFKNGLLVERNALRDENDGMHTTNLRIVRELTEARAERDALRKAVDAVRATRTEPQTRTGDNDDWVDGFQYGYGAALETVNDELAAALAVQP